MYVLALCAQFALCTLFARFGASTFELALVPAPVAVYAANGNVGRALGFVLAAALGAATVNTHWVLVGYYTFVSALGLLVGLGMAQRWSYGRIVAVMSGMTFCISATCVVIAWDRWIAEAAQLYLFLTEFFKRQVGQTTDDSSELILSQFRWVLLDNWRAIGLGMMFWPTLLMSCLCVSLSARWLRRQFHQAGPRGSFAQMRTSEWLVWIVILVAGLWFVDHQWPALGMKPVVWNTAVILGVIYWVNGVSIVAFGLFLVQPRPVASALIFVGVVFFCGFYVPCFLGLADTWVDFRRKLEAWDAARRQPKDTGHET